MSGTAGPRRARGRWTLIALASLFLAPLAIAWLLYFGGIWAPGEGANHGELLRPVVTLPRAEQPAPGGGVHAGGYLYGKWSLVYLGDGGCDDDCAGALVTTRQVRLALGRYLDRIQRVLFVAGATDESGLPDDPGLLVVLLDGAPGQTIAGLLGERGGAGRIFLVDPLGNLVLAYPRDAPPADIRDDLKRLLRISRIG